MTEAPTGIERMPRSGAARTLLWAAFLASSWTWCIGMFLPVLLVRDFGLLGYLAFFIPNVLGAAAMGWIVRGPDAAARLVRAHAPAMRAFSLVTIAFQAYFAAWFARTAGAGVWPVAAGAAALLYILLLRIGSLRGGLLAWVASAAVFAWLGANGALSLPRAAPVLPAGAVLFLAPVCVFGFALCPYLDLTFHGAAAGAGPSRRAAFTLGFGGLFAMMIVFTLLYAPLLMDPAGMHAGAPAAVLALLGVHIFGQLAYTCGVHHSYLARSHGAARAGGAYLIVAAAVLAAGLLAPLHRPVGALSLGEAVYRSFMAFYGLIFPAYVWLCVIPRRGPVAPPSRHALRVWALAVGIAIPMFWKGFIARETWWLGPGLLVVLLARLALPRAAPVTASAPGPSTA